MLCRLGRWLRIFGYDTRIINEELDDKRSKKDVTNQRFVAHKSSICDDDLLIEIAKKDGRILVTRDMALYNRSIKNNLKSVYIRSNFIERQIFELKQAIGIEVALKMTRCTMCNGDVKLYTSNREELSSIDYIPERLLSDKKERLWVCTKCGQFYWIGNHWRMMRLMVEKVNDLR